eukprot:UC4_evm2s1277
MDAPTKLTRRTSSGPTKRSNDPPIIDAQNTVYAFRKEELEELIQAGYFGGKGAFPKILASTSGGTLFLWILIRFFNIVLYNDDSACAPNSYHTHFNITDRHYHGRFQLRDDNHDDVDFTSSGCTEDEFEEMAEISCPLTASAYLLYCIGVTGLIVHGIALHRGQAWMIRLAHGLITLPFCALENIGFPVIAGWPALCFTLWAAVGDKYQALPRVYGALACWTITFYFQYCLYRNRKKADDLIKDDKLQYDKIWKEIITNEDENSQIFQIKKVIEDIKYKNVDNKTSSDPSDKIENQQNMVVQAIEGQLKEAMQMKGSKKARQLIRSLPVLFGHAELLNPEFQQKINELAKISSADSVHNDIPIKRRRRAIEKLCRTYANDASKLIDVVRSNVTFKSLREVVTCLESIRDDPTLIILQIKNRFHDDYDSKDSAGYRNICLSLALVNDVTMSLGVDIHVCELQLGLKAFDDYKKEDGHARYVQWRNARAEESHERNDVLGRDQENKWLTFHFPPATCEDMVSKSEQTIIRCDKF